MKSCFATWTVGHNVLASGTPTAGTGGELPAIRGVSVPILKLHALLGLELPPGRHAAALHVRYARTIAGRAGSGMP